MKLFLLLMAAHICGDVLIYSPKLSAAKRAEGMTKRMKATFFHCLNHFLLIVCFLILFSYAFSFSLFAAVCIAGAHFLIDITRIHIEDGIFNKKELVIIKKKDLLRYLLGHKDTELAPFIKRYGMKWLFLNVLDQGFHVSTILLFTLIFT